ncbi:MAG: ABC transporter C-terminal domain-containing protein, partial [Ignavibacteria bacterium]
PNLLCFSLFTHYKQHRPNKTIRLYSGGIEYYLEKRKELVAGVKEMMQEKSNQAQTATRKDQKRLEAELRQKRYAVTRDIVKDVQKLEEQIELLESKKKKIEDELATPEVYSSPVLARDKHTEYAALKESLEEMYFKWTELTEKLEELEKQFNE